MPILNFKTSILPSEDNTFSLGSSTKRWQINGNDMLDIMYPVGAVYISVVECDPGQLFGGTWVQIKDTFLLSAGDTYTNGDTGGSVSNSHTHTMAHTHTMSHTHSQVATTSGGPSNNTSGSTAISVAQMPSHNHGSAGAHQHGSPSNYYICGTNGSYVVEKSSGWGIPNWSLQSKTASAGAHTHSSNGSGSGHTHTLSSHTHSTSATTTGGASNATTSAASNATTSDASNTNNMPPYLVVYMYKRTA